ncbi:putative ABC transport system ATP-binding protein [Hamadaea flava]|uniref:ABC transporter ATP-binding protein n=1 Tax=Hamadaea flava TaxID=1742688 RepID=A0ABV8LS05_9ACTN|nr:ABC transporter ATP-binding protein [Hamadaea flava]MCP2328364.1 putative ABC transport system ATP-binding protein [Hamadaea flava]
MSRSVAPSATSSVGDPASPGSGLVLQAVYLQHGDAAETVQALDDVHLSVQPGELAAVVGPSGAGKSSLLAVAGGLARPDRGIVTVAGHDMTVASRRLRTSLRQRHVGFVFQSGNLLPALTAVDQLRLAQRIAPRAERAVRDPYELLTEVGMADKANRRPDQLSGGERQRVGIARALVTEPSVLLVDEPTAALDRARSHDIVQLLAREAARRSVAVVMVTHDHDVLQYCDTVYEMIDGKLRADK